MQYASARQAILDLLRNKKKVKNRELLEAIGDNQVLFREVRDDLIFEELAEDFKEVGLVLLEQAVVSTPKASQSLSYDIFFSYSHKDNQHGKIDEVVNQIKAQHRAFSRDHLRIFYDREGIRSMDDWEHQILQALKNCKVMIALLTPNYFASDYCRKEWQRFVELEMDYALDGQAIAPLYVITFSAFEKSLGEIVENWPKDLKRRQYVDMRFWWEEGKQAMQKEVIEERFAHLEQQCYDRIQKASRYISSYTTIPPHNPKFVGRREELRQIRESLSMGHTGTLVVLQGLAGMGKSALAFEYAHLFGTGYPGGRFLVQGAHQHDLKTAFSRLADDKGVLLSDDERKDPELVYRKVRAAFEKGEASLILFDNVDHEELLALEQVASILPAADHLHIMATTRLGVEQFSGACVISVQELPEESSLRLLEHHRPFIDEAALAAAKSIVQLLQGYTLAIEVVGVYLWKNPEISYQQYLEQLEQLDLQTLDKSGSQEEVQLSRHREKIVSRILAPTLEQLSKPEQQVVQYAALLPSDQISLPWLKELVAKENQVGWKADGALFPWERLVRKLKGLGIFTETNEPNVVRMHRIFQAVVSGKWLLTEQQGQLSTYVFQKAEDIVGLWYLNEHQWNIAPLMSYCEGKLQDNSVEGTQLVDFVFQLLKALGRFTEASYLLNKGRLVAESWYQSPHPELSIRYSNLATIEQDLGNFQAAKAWMLKAIEENDEKIYQPPHPKLGTSYSILATIEQNLGNFQAAKAWMLKAIEENDEKIYQPPHPKLGIRYYHLGHIDYALNNIEAARYYMELSYHCMLGYNGQDHQTTKAVKSWLDRWACS